jgi:hypothetical protein
VTPCLPRPKSKIGQWTIDLHFSFSIDQYSFPPVHGDGREVECLILAAIKRLRKFFDQIVLEANAVSHFMNHGPIQRAASNRGGAT